MNKEEAEKLIKMLTELLETPRFVVIFQGETQHSLHMISALNAEGLKELLTKISEEL